MAVRGALSTISELIWKLLIQLVREIFHWSGKSQRISKTSGCSNHVLDDEDIYLNVTNLIEYFKKLI